MVSLSEKDLGWVQSALQKDVSGFERHVRFSKGLSAIVAITVDEGYIGRPKGHYIPSHVDWILDFSIPIIHLHIPRSDKYCAASAIAIFLHEVGHHTRHRQRAKQAETFLEELMAWRYAENTWNNHISHPFPKSLVKASISSYL